MRRSWTVLRRVGRNAVAAGLLTGGFVAALPLVAQGPATGTLTGRVVDGRTQQPVANATVTVSGTERGTLTDGTGAFTIRAVPVGSRTIEVRHLAYRARAVPDVVIRPERITSVLVEMEESAVQLEGVTVAPSFFRRAEERPAGSIRFSAEEIRRAPGSAGDISRIILGLPSLAKVSDQYNGLAVRGGSPAENAFFVDNIEVPNINHFPAQGSSGGALGLLNVDLVREVEFQAGGFSAEYGDRLSSVMEISLREGNRGGFGGKAEVNFAGFGGLLEGPLPGQGSWLISLRRSYLDLLVKAVDMGTTLAPRYGDGQAKVVQDLGSRHRLTGIGIWSDDHIRSDLETALENDMQVYGRQDLEQNTFGLNWRALWARNVFSSTAVSVTRAHFDEDFIDTPSGAPVMENRSLENTVRFRHTTQVALEGAGTLRFGLDASRATGTFRNVYGERFDPFGAPVPALEVGRDLVAERLGAFVNLAVRPLPRVTATLGSRVDQLRYSGRLHIAPRIGLSHEIGEWTTARAAAGVYHQQLPLVLLAQQDENRELRTPRATHLVIGLDHLVATDTRLTVEAYRKSYHNLPLDPAQPAAFLFDEAVAGNTFFEPHESLTDDGRARAAGIEAVVQKHLAENIYGTVSAALFRTRYRGADEIWRPRVYENRVLLAAEGGYRPRRDWELSARWLFAGGHPHTPIDPEHSESLGRTVLDASRVNVARYPHYHSLNVRIDRRMHFRTSNLVGFISVWNAYGRRNVASYFWNPRTAAIEPIHQWGTLPIFGLEYEF